MSNKYVGLVLAIAGLLAVLASVLADSLGVSTWRGFGAAQWTGTILGALAFLAGLGLYSRVPRAA